MADHKNKIFDRLNSLTKAGYIVILTTKSTCKLQEEGQGSDSFCVLNFYDRESKKLYLVNCPFVLSKWKDKDRNEALNLRLLKAHYNNNNQMSIWLDDDKLQDYFETFTVCYVNENYERSELKAYSKEYLFFKFQAG
jgi:hypothetical protein